MRKIKIKTPEEKRIEELEKENELLKEANKTQDTVIEELMFVIIPEIVGGGI